LHRGFWIEDLESFVFWWGFFAVGELIFLRVIFRVFSFLQMAGVVQLNCLAVFR